MSTTLKKSLLIGLGILAITLIAIGVVYLVRKPAPVAPLPTPKLTVAALPSPTVAPIFAIDPVSACTQTFVVACASSTPSATPSATPSISPSPSAPVFASPSPSTPASANLDCVSKKVFNNDSRNRAGFYYMESEIKDASTVQNGQVIVYNVTAKNAGGNSVPDTTITDTLSSNLTYLDGDSGCTYNSTSRVVTCTIGSLSPNSEAQRSFRATVSSAGTTSIANTAEVASTNGQRDSCSVNISATGQIVSVASPAPTALPVAGVFEITMGTMGIGLLLLIAGALGLLLI